MFNLQPPTSKQKKILILSGVLLLIVSSVAVFLFFYKAAVTSQNQATNSAVKDEEEEEKKEDARLADPRIVKLVNEHTKNTAWKLNAKPSTAYADNRVIHVSDGLTMIAPGQSEEATQEEAKLAQAKYAAKYMSPELLDVVYSEYHQNGQAVLSSFGINQVCQTNGCKYQVSDQSSLLQAYQGQIAKGDTIDSINGQSLDHISDYKSARNLIFQNNPTMIQVTSAQGNQRIIYINHSQSALSTSY